MSKKIKWILVIAWMITIFWFSSQPAVISDSKSRSVIEMFKVLGLNLNSILGNLANFIVRKVAHFTEYFILYMLVFNALKESVNVKKSLLASLLVVFLYASSDEVHQLFVQGRSSQFRDVIIDTCGGMLALVILWRKNKKKINKEALN